MATRYGVFNGHEGTEIETPSERRAHDWMIQRAIAAQQGQRQVTGGQRGGIDPNDPIGSDPFFAPDQAPATTLRDKVQSERELIAAKTNAELQIGAQAGGNRLDLANVEQGGATTRQGIASQAGIMTAEDARAKAAIQAESDQALADNVRDKARLIGRGYNGKPLTRQEMALAGVSPEMYADPDDAIRRKVMDGQIDKALAAMDNPNPAVRQWAAATLAKYGRDRNGAPGAGTGYVPGVQDDLQPDAIKASLAAMRPQDAMPVTPTATEVPYLGDQTVDPETLVPMIQSQLNDFIDKDTDAWYTRAAGGAAKGAGAGLVAGAGTGAALAAAPTFGMGVVPAAVAGGGIGAIIGGIGGGIKGAFSADADPGAVGKTNMMKIFSELVKAYEVKFKYRHDLAVQAAIQKMHEMGKASHQGGDYLTDWSGDETRDLYKTIDEYPR